MRLLVLAALLLAVTACTDDSPSASDTLAQTSPNQLTSAASTRQPSITTAPRTWTPVTINGFGDQNTRSFDIPTGEWELCLELTAWDTLSNGTPIGIAYVDVERESDGRSVASLSADAGVAGSRSGCTVVRSQGRHYFEVIASSTVGWKVTARP